MTIENTQYSCQYQADAEEDETVLIQRAQSGDLNSFNSIVLKYQDILYRTALRILERDQLADDVTQDAFISVYQNILAFRGGSFKGWLLRIVINKCYDEIRRGDQAPSISLNESFTDEGENETLYMRLQEHTPTVEKRIETLQQMEFVQDCLSKLPPDYRVVLVLIDIEEMTYHDTSILLNIPVGTVKSRLARARSNVRQKLIKEQLL